MAITVGPGWMESLLLEDREAARIALETWAGENADCAEHYERALFAWRAAESALENMRVVTPNQLWELATDPRVSYLRVLEHIDTLVGCLREDAPPPTGGGGGNGGGGEPPADVDEDEPPPPPPSSFPWRTVAGLGLLVAAGYGFWRMKR